MAGPLEELTDGYSQCRGDGCDRRGARVDASPLGASNRLTMQIAPQQSTMNGARGVARPTKRVDQFL
jgi:hypothetical protein